MYDEIDSLKKVYRANERCIKKETSTLGKPNKFVTTKH